MISRSFTALGVVTRNRIGASVRNKLSFVNFYLSVKLELWRILFLAKSRRSRSVTLVFDLKVVGPGYGDFLYQLHLALVLQKAFIVKVIFVDRGRRPDWRIMNSEQQARQIEQYERMAVQVLKGKGCSFLWVKALEDCKTESPKSHIVFERRVFNKNGIWHHSSSLASAIFYKIGCGDGQLFGPQMFGPLRESPREKFVVWHVRRGNLTPGKTESINSFLQQYHRIKATLGSKVEIVLVSSPNGLRELSGLAYKLGLELTSSRKYSDDFVGDLNLVHRASLYIQFGNGGMYIGAVCSKTSFFLGSNVNLSGNFNSFEPKVSLTATNRAKAFGVDIRKSKMSSWQSDTQILQTFRLLNSSEPLIDWGKFRKLVVNLGLD